jgi:small subunit ribosomal protein S20
LVNISSAQKSTRSSLKKQERNKAVKSSTKTRVAKADNLMAGGNKEAAKAAVKEASSALDKAAKRKILHANTVSRNKSRLARRLNKMAETTTEKAAVKTAAKKTTKKKTEK